jgi:putative addiction module component (TIGR02574 family)
MADPARLLAEALDLPVRERLRIASALLRSVDPEEDADAEEAWLTELDKRSAGLADGTAKTVDAKTVHAEVRAALRARRAARP